MSRISASEAVIRSLPLKRISPLMRVLRARVRPMTVRLETDLPEPDSPTMPSAWPSSISYETPSTACTTPSSVSNETVRSRISSSANSVPHTWVDERVRDVDDQVGHDDEERAEQHGALDHGHVAVLDRVVGEAPDARDVEHGLGEDRAAEQHADVQAGRGDDRRARGAQRVAQDDPALAQALGPRGADVVL